MIVLGAPNHPVAGQVRAPFMQAQPFCGLAHYSRMKQITPLLLALIPLAAVVSACVLAP